MDTDGHFWTLANIFQLWTTLDNFGQLWTTLDISALANIFQHFSTFSNTATCKYIIDGLLYKVIFCLFFVKNCHQLWRFRIFWGLTKYSRRGHFWYTYKETKKWKGSNFVPVLPKTEIFCVGVFSRLRWILTPTLGFAHFSRRDKILETGAFLIHWYRDKKKRR